MTPKKSSSSDFLKENVFESVCNIKKKFKVKDLDFKIIKMRDYELLKTHQFKVAQLKEICCFYKLKKTGNKDEITNRIYNHLKYSLYVLKIQSVVRGFFLRKFIILAGIGMKNRDNCLNDTDFATLEPIKTIQFNQFFSFTDNTGSYGCDIISFGGIIKRLQCQVNNKKELYNPFNREKISENTIKRFKTYLKLGRIIKMEQIVEQVEEVIDPKKKMEFRIIELFQYINELGNYADSQWFNNLTVHQLVIFIRELYDIWNYRAQLSPLVMREIVPPSGNPFIGLQLHLAQNQSEDSLRKTSLKIMELLVKSGYSQDNKSLGAYYVLAALTLVSQDARGALPWLYQSVAYNNN